MVLLRQVLSFIAVLLFCSSLLQAEPLLLKDKLLQAQLGDFVVIEYQKTYTFFYVLDIEDQNITLGEISLPSYQVKEGHVWRSWFLSGAPKHLSWVNYRFDRGSGNLEQAYSLSERAYLDVAQLSSFLPQLMGLNFDLVPQQKRQRIGPPPVPGEEDERPLWQPSVRCDGKRVSGIQFDVWQALWPQDGSELAGKNIEVYLARDSEIIPNYFPYWLQLKDQWRRATLRIVDSGRKLLSQ